ncbi:hypothetical protein EDD11_004096 [Mortierella claussenii]|nr:hypothetical protein EDD11_004096 [Mortierella claussenii]
MVVGGSIGRKRDFKDDVVIAKGLDKFSSQGKISSQHSRFASYFINRMSYRDSHFHDFMWAC